MADPSSKEEQLARIRRNQQRSRDRKRARLADLESQVVALRLRLRQCSPCPSSPPSPSGDTLEQLRRENAARRDMLLNLGWSDEMQQRFIDAMTFASLPQLDVQTGVGIDPNPVQTNTLILPSAELVVPVQPQLSNWVVEANLTNLAAPTPDATLYDISGSVNNAERRISHIQDSVTASLPGARRSVSGLETQTSPAQCCASGHSNGTSQSLDAFDSSIGRCFLETAIAFRPGDSLLACSDAIRMALQHNRKGLSLAQLHDRMKPGFVMKNNACLVKDDVLFALLAEISAADSYG